MRPADVGWGASRARLSPAGSVGESARMPVAQCASAAVSSGSGPDGVRYFFPIGHRGVFSIRARAGSGVRPGGSRNRVIGNARRARSGELTARIARAARLSAGRMPAAEAVRARARLDGAVAPPTPPMRAAPPPLPSLFASAVALAGAAAEAQEREAAALATSVEALAARSGGGGSCSSSRVGAGAGGVVGRPGRGSMEALVLVGLPSLTWPGERDAGIVSESVRRQTLRSPEGCVFPLRPFHPAGSGPGFARLRSIFVPFPSGTRSGQRTAGLSDIGQPRRERRERGQSGAPAALLAVRRKCACSGQGGARPGMIML